MVNVKWMSSSSSASASVLLLSLAIFACGSFAFTNEDSTNSRTARGFFFPQMSILTRWQAVRRPPPATIALQRNGNLPVPVLGGRRGQIQPNQFFSRMGLSATPSDASVSATVNVRPTSKTEGPTLASATAVTTMTTAPAPVKPRPIVNVKVKAVVTDSPSIFSLPVQPVPEERKPPLDKDQMEKLILKRHIEKIIADGTQSRSEIQKILLQRKKQQAMKMSADEEYSFVVEVLGSGESSERPVRKRSKDDKKLAKLRAKEARKNRRRNKKKPNETARIFSSIVL